MLKLVDFFKSNYYFYCLKKNKNRYEKLRFELENQT